MLLPLAQRHLMYGLINDAVRRLVVEDHGYDAWRQIADRAGSAEAFAAMSYYDDALTYDLVAAASAVLNVPAEELLARFGRFWSTRIGPESYAEFLSPEGTDLVTVVRRLDAMHARLQSTFPHLRPPSFSVRERSDASMEIHYRSTREGLAPFVVGLLEGLGELYGTPVHVRHVGVRGADGDHDVFELILRP